MEVVHVAGGVTNSLLREILGWGGGCTIEFWAWLSNKAAAGSNSLSLLLCTGAKMSNWFRVSSPATERTMFLSNLFCFFNAEHSLSINWELGCCCCWLSCPVELSKLLSSSGLDCSVLSKAGFCCMVLSNCWSWAALRGVSRDHFYFSVKD